MKTNFLIKNFFFGNYFYGVCAVALSLESTLQQQIPLNPSYYYLAIFTTTTWYYTLAYISEQTNIIPNERTFWYIENQIFVRLSQRVLFSFSFILLSYFIYTHWGNIFRMSIKQFLLLLFFPIVAVLYYGINSKIIGAFNLRSIGWMKPIVIALTWAGLVTIYPILFYKITHQLEGTIETRGFLLFIKNVMFVLVLGIMFDIKDYAIDSNHQLKTFVVEHGLRKTIFYLIIPLSSADLGSFLIFGLTHQFSTMKILLNTIPFILMILLAYSLYKRHSILYYLVLIDGLLLVKAICGSVAMIYF